MDHTPVILGDVPQFRFILCLLTIQILCLWQEVTLCTGQIHWSLVLLGCQTLSPEYTGILQRLLHSAITVLLCDWCPARRRLETVGLSWLLHLFREQ